MQQKQRKEIDMNTPSLVQVLVSLVGSVGADVRVDVCSCFLSYGLKLVRRHKNLDKQPEAPAAVIIACG